MLKRVLLAWSMLFAGMLISAQDPCLNAFQAADQESQAFLKDKTKTKYHNNWEKLIGKFERIPKSYPTCSKADDALFRAGKLWLECFKISRMRDDRESAINDFEAVAKKYPKSTLADDALLYAGKTYLDLNDKESAKDEFSRIATRYPNSDSAPQANKLMGDLEAASLAKFEPSEAESSTAEPKPVFSSGSPEESQTVAEAPAKAPLRKNDAIAVILGKNGATEAASEPAQLKDLRYWSAASYTRVVLDLDRKPEITAPKLLQPDPTINAPPRIYFDLLNAHFSQDFREKYTYKDNCFEFPIGDGLLRRARAGQYKPDVVRVVLDLQSIRDFKYFTFPGGDEGGFRMVIDIYGEQKAAPPPLPPPQPQPGLTAKPEPQPVPALPAKPAPKPAAQKPEKKPLIIIIDPGHGGKDPGAMGKRQTMEKDIALAVGEDLAKELQKKFPDAEIILTRKDDRYLTLVERTAKANALAADTPNVQDVLFISVHCNANPNRKTAGVETYYLDNTTDRATLRLAAQENFVSEEVMSKSGDYTNQILADMATNSKVNFSIPLADCVQKCLVKELGSKYSGVNNLGVKKAPFWVLTGATMPSILVELSFLSNLTEEKRLTQSTYQKTLARGIAAGVKEYQKKIESGQVALP